MGLFSRKDKSFIVTVLQPKDIRVSAKNKTDARAKAQQRGYKVQKVTKEF